MENLYEKLKAYGSSDYYPFHMPGHKRNVDKFSAGLPFTEDITEIDGFDDLHHAEGILRQAEERAARIYHSEETHFLVNGSTVGILSAILGVTQRGDQILVARNCHKSVYHAIFMNELHPIYVYPTYETELQINGVVSKEEIQRLLEEYPDVRAVIIVSPTYDGVVSDVKGIAEVVHAHQIPLIVDEAHGAHFGFHSYFPETSITQGADIVIHSVHKTLPAMTQTALIHLNGTIICRESIRQYLHMLQSSSPSYILMASIDSCMELLEEAGETLFAEYVERLQNCRETLGRMKHLKLVRTDVFDPSKLILSVKDAKITSNALRKRLLEIYHLQMEMTAGSYVLAMTSIGDTDEGLHRLCHALFEIDETLESEEGNPIGLELPRLPFCYCSAHVGKNKAYVEWRQAKDCVAAEYAYLYPPGIPFVVPGEQITEEAIRCLEMYEELGFTIEGIAVEKKIGVWING